MSEVRTTSKHRLRWIALSMAIGATTYLVSVMVGLFNEANMVFGFLRPEVRGIERLLTAREEMHQDRDSVLTPRQISTVLSVAENVMNVPEGPSAAINTRDILVGNLNAASMTLGEYRYVRDMLDASLRGTAERDSVLNDRLALVRPRLLAVRKFFTEYRDSIALSTSFE